MKTIIWRVVTNIPKVYSARAFTTNLVPMNYNQYYVDAYLPNLAAILQKVTNEEIIRLTWRESADGLTIYWLILSEQPTVHSYLAWVIGKGCQHAHDYSMLYRVSIIQHGKRMRRLILSSVTCMNVPYFSTLTHKRDDFWSKILHITCVLIFSTSFVWSI